MLSDLTLLRRFLCIFEKKNFSYGKLTSDWNHPLVSPTFPRDVLVPRVTPRNGRTTNGNDNKPYPSAEQISAHKQHASGVFLPRERNFSRRRVVSRGCIVRKRRPHGNAKWFCMYRALADFDRWRCRAKGSSSFQPLNAAIKSLLARKPSAPTVCWLSRWNASNEARLSDRSDSYGVSSGFSSYVDHSGSCLYNRCRVRW